MYKLILIVALLVTGFSCNKENLEEYNGTIKDFTGRLDGCGYVIDLDSGERLLPGFNSSGVSLIPERRVAIKYKTKPAFNTCMAGETIEIVALRYL